MIPLLPGDKEKLNDHEGRGDYEEDGTAFSAWQFDWPGGDGVHVIYFEGERSIVDREWVAISPAQ